MADGSAGGGDSSANTGTTAKPHYLATSSEPCVSAAASSGWSTPAQSTQVTHPCFAETHRASSPAILVGHAPGLPVHVATCGMRGFGTFPSALRTDVLQPALLLTRLRPRVLHPRVHPPHPAHHLRVHPGNMSHMASCPSGQGLSTLPHAAFATVVPTPWTVLLSRHHSDQLLGCRDTRDSLPEQLQLRCL